MLNAIITGRAKQAFSGTMKFDDGRKPLPAPGNLKKSRLLYIHIPFCEQLCPYCSFHRVVFDAPLCRNYFDALRKEIVLYKECGYEFGGVYVGGGTPTIIMEELEHTLLLAKQCFALRQISVETNPNHLTETNMASLKIMGVNRLSVGIQSFDNHLLQQMDRFEKYGSGDVIAERLISATGIFDTLNADMIFNFPSQTLKTLERDLDILMNIGMDQITYYPLMVSDSTRDAVTKKLGPFHYQREKQFYRRITERLIPPYGHSSAWCFSKKSMMIDEYIVDYDEYAGLGSGSIGYLNGMCYANTFNISEYIAQVNRGEIPMTAFKEFSMRDRMRYDFLMKLFGMKLDVPLLRKKYGGSFYGVLWPDILAFSLIGGLRYRRPCIYLTRRGCYMWVIMMREFFIAVNNFRDFCRARIS